MDTSNSSSRANPRPIDIKVRNAVENHYSENPIESTLVEKLTSSFEETGQAVQCQPVEDYPLGVVTQIEPVQSGSGDPSPDNIRPITGYTTCKLYHSGKNLFNIDKALNNVLTKEGENYKCGYFPGVGRQSKYVNLFAPAGATIRLSAEILEDTTTTGYPISMQLYYEDGHNGETIDLVYAKTLSKTHGNLKMARIICNIEESGNAAYVVFRNLQVEIGSTATPFEPYNEDSNIFTLDLGQTVYGGSLDWKTGVLTITHELEVFDGNNKTLRYSILQKSDGTEAVCCMATTTAVTGQIFSYVCSHLRRDDASPKTYEYGTFYITGNRYFVAFIEEFADANELTAWLVEQYSNGTPFTIGYELATPITVQLTPTEILALSGANILTSDCGNTTVTGKVDPTAAVEKLTNAIIALGGTV